MQNLTRIGEVSYSTYGQKMTIIEYNGSMDLSVEFEDGTVVKNKTYTFFKRGNIKNPNFKPFNRVGEKRKMNNGQIAEIINYKHNTDLDVKFEDGTIVKNKNYGDFKKGEIKNPNFTLKEKRIGEISYSLYGQKMELIKYVDCKNVTVKFEDGTIVEGKPYDSFLRGKISNPNYFQTYVGKESISMVGQKMKLIRYGNRRDCDIEFEDGTIVYHKAYGAFKRGEVGNPNFYKKRYVGLSKLNTEGLKITICDYRKSTDIDICFEDGTIVRNKQMNEFDKGHIPHPDKWQEFVKSRIGEKAKALNGQIMEIIEYRGSNDIDVKFEDGYIATKIKYCTFQKGEVKNPYYWQNKRIGEVIVSRIGEPMKIVAYRKRDDIDVEFEGNIVVEHTNYSQFETGRVGHPYIKNNGMQIPVLTINNITGKKVFDRYYHCQCSKCKLDTVMTFIEAKNHKC